MKDCQTDGQTDRLTDGQELYIKSPRWRLKSKKDPKIKSKSKVRIDGTIENKSCPTT